MRVIGGPCSSSSCLLYLEGSLRAPLDGALRHTVHALLRRGERIIFLDLSRVSRIDAAGVSELVRTYNIVIERNGVLQIVNATSRVRQILQRAGLYSVLSPTRGIVTS